MLATSTGTTTSTTTSLLLTKRVLLVLILVRLLVLVLVLLVQLLMLVLVLVLFVLAGLIFQWLLQTELCLENRTFRLVVSRCFHCKSQSNVRFSKKFCLHACGSRSSHLSTGLIFQQLLTEHKVIREDYLSALTNHCNTLEKTARSLGFDYHRFDSHGSVGPALAALLGRRALLARGGRAG